MDRAPDNNGHTTGSVRARGGYDAYFTPQPGTGEVAVAETPPSDDRPNTTYTPATPPTATPPAAGPPQHTAAPTVGTPGATSWSPSESAAAQPNTTVPQQAEGVAAGTAATSAGYDRSVSYERPAAQTQAQPERPQAQTGPVANPVSGATQSASVSRVPDRIARPHAERPIYDTGLPEVSRPTMTSMDLLAEIAATRRAQLRSNSGMRGALNKVGFNLGLSPAEQRTEDRRGRIRRQLTAPYQIAVLSVKGGVGRTTVSAALGSTFASLRPDRVIAVDANPDFGDLPARTSRHPYGLTLRDMVRTSHLDSFSAVHSFTSINTADLSVLASPWNTEATEALSGQEYGAAVEVLRRHYNLVLVDCGTGVLDSVTTSVLQTSDAVVVVTPATVGGVKGAVATLNWLASHGLQHLIASSIVSIVHHQPLKPTVDVEHIEKLFATAQRPTFVMPYDEHLAEGGEIDLRLLDKDTALSFEELAAALADGFPAQPGGAQRDHGGWR